MNKKQKKEWKKIRDTGVDEPMSKFYDRIEQFISNIIKQEREKMGKAVKEAYKNGRKSVYDEVKETILEIKRDLQDTKSILKFIIKFIIKN